MTSTTARREDRLAFGGAGGAAALTIGLPLVVVYLLYCVRLNGGSLLPGSAAHLDEFCHELLPSWRAVAFYAGWLLLQTALHIAAPGKVALGGELSDGSRLAYKINGAASLAVTACIAAILQLTGALPLSFLYDNLVPIVSVATIFAVGFALFLYFYGRATDPRNLSGNALYDFFMGTGHNPRLPAGGIFDLKFFCESRPGLILWLLLDASYADAELRRHGRISAAMLLVVTFQAVYVLDYFANEAALLTTMDIRQENFGFMLVFGDLVWVPVTFSLQGAYLVDHARALAWWAIAGIVCCEVAGYYVFRVANLQKHRFRADPSAARIWGREPRYLRTQNGSTLLLSGFWGWSRHFNYVGDILMACAWSSPCLFGAPVPYFYPAYLTGLLIHRERRDNEHCARKYGSDWEEYCRRVPWRIVPGVY